MIRMSRLACGLVLWAGIVVLIGCDVPSLAPDETEEVDPGNWYGKPIKMWIVESKDEDLKDNAKAYLDRVGPEDKDLIPALLWLLKNDNNGDVRAGAAKLLGQMGPSANNKEVLDALEDAITDSDPGVLRATLSARKRIVSAKP